MRLVEETKFFAIKLNPFKKICLNNNMRLDVSTCGIEESHSEMLGTELNFLDVEEHVGLEATDDVDSSYFISTTALKHAVWSS